MAIKQVCLLGLGEVGSIFAEDLLRKTAVNLRVWDRDLDRPGSPARENFLQLAAGRVQRSASAADAACDCDLVLSAVTAGQAVAAATSILPGIAPGCWLVDVNSVSPGTKQRLDALVTGAGGRFVEASIMSPINPLRTDSPVVLSGVHASAFSPLGQSLGFAAMQAISDQPGVAAATKMCRSVIIKGMEALVAESLLTARHYGVDDAVLASLNNLFPRPDWAEHARYLITRTLQHGARRAEEMREVARTVGEAGLRPWMSEGCAERQQWAAQFGELQGEASLDSLLDAVLARLEPEQSTTE